MSDNIYLISGVSGVGKTAIIPHLKILLPASFEIHDFDERGVPNNAGHEWRLNETRYWLSLGEKKLNEGLTLVVCGFFNPDEIDTIKKEFINMEIKTILLDGEAETLEERLRNRNANENVKNDLERVVGSAEAFIKNNSKFVPILRGIYESRRYQVIDTSHLDPASVAKQLSDLIAKN